jgi:quinol-cytochrome oxidoreductase complex cytochrome b subunit
VCAQVVVVSVWKLLSLTKDDRILTRASVPWVNMIIGAIAAAAVVVIGALGALLTRADDPGLPLLMFIAIVALTALALFVYVLRHVLLRAIALRRDDAPNL